MKKMLFLFLIIFISKTYSQNKYFDWIVTKDNDTIYGVIQIDGLNQYILKEKNKSSENRIKFYSHNIFKSKSFRYNYDIYFYDEDRENNFKQDPIYSNNDVKKDSSYFYKYLKNYVNKDLKQTDYIVSIKNDTIYGKILKPLLGKPYLISNNQEKLKIDIKKLKSYRYKNKIYFNLSSVKKRYKFLELLVDGKVKLFYDKDYNKSYGLGVNSPMVNISQTGAYYIQQENTFFRVGVMRFKKQMSDLFNKNKVLSEKIINEEFTYNNLRLMIEYYNKS